MNFSKNVLSFIEDYKKFKSFNTKNVSSKTFLKQQKYSDKFLKNIKDELEIIYNSGFGYKILARELDISYTSIKTVLNKVLLIKTRHGKNIVTDKLKKFRSEKAIREDFGKNIKNRVIKNSTKRGVQGYFWNETKNKYCWLRSSYEYIFAKCLNENKIIWDSEVEYLEINDGKKYLPDFFIYDKDNNLINLIEIKGYSGYDRGKHFNIKTDIPLILIDNIELFLPINSTINKQRNIWKKHRKMKLEL